MQKVNNSIEVALDFHRKGQLLEAKNEYIKILKYDKKNYDALHLLGVLYYQERKYKEALDLIDKSINLYSRNPAAYSNKGIVLIELNKNEEALNAFATAIELKPDYFEAYLNQGNVLIKIKKPDEALRSLKKAYELNSEFVETSFNLGNAYKILGEKSEATYWYLNTLKLNPNHVLANTNLGLVYYESGELERALRYYEEALKLEPTNYEALLNKGVLLAKNRKYEIAAACYKKAIEINPTKAEGYSNLATLLMMKGEIKESLVNYNFAINLDGDRAELYLNRGLLHLKLENLDETLKNFYQARNLQPELDYLYGHIVYVEMMQCDWSRYDLHLQKIKELRQTNKKIYEPFNLLSLVDDLELHLKNAEIYVESKYREKTFYQSKPSHNNKKIRIGYYSADFHEHATSHLMAEMFGYHNKEEFEIIAFSFGPRNNDLMQQKLIKKFTEFHFVNELSDEEISSLSNQLKIDIAVDLKGYTKDCRPGIFANRAAPIQVNYLGYPGTMGANYIDYIIADRFIVPDKSDKYYSERVVKLDDCYQVNHSKKEVSNFELSRSELGLPRDCFIFCCFNNSYKITPMIFNSWMNIMKRVESSVIWLLSDDKKVIENLKREAEERDIRADRLIFARRCELSLHLKRHDFADLFLDTFPYNAHTTASDALWVDLPLLTIRGESFASRVASSLLSTIGLDELITTSISEYEEKAVELAKNPQIYKEIQQKIIKNKESSTLYRPHVFTKRLEIEFKKMMLIR